MKTYSAPDYEKDRRKVGYLASLPIFVSIPPLIGTIFFQTTLSLTGTQAYSDPRCFGTLFAASALAALGTSGTFDVGLVKSLAAALTIGIALILVILSSYAIKGKRVFFYASFGLYGADSLLLIPLLIVSRMIPYPLNLTAVDIVLLAVIHAVGLAFFFYTTRMMMKMERFEKAYQKPRK
jgi:hypothetical protein